MSLHPMVEELAEKSYQKHVGDYKIQNDQMMIIIDYTQPSNEKRLYLYDRINKKVMREHHVAHGVGSADPSDRRMAINFSNVPMSKKSNIGGLVTDDLYKGKYGRSMRIRGLESGVNDNCYKRTIVFHRSNYVKDSYIKSNGFAGRSWGCPAMDPAIFDSFLDIIGGSGVFCYFYGGQDD